jgi:N6-adenosine-specific RNA methylase IME4
MPRAEGAKNDRAVDPASPTFVALPSVPEGALPLSLEEVGAGPPFGTVLVDPPWRFVNRTGKVAPEHRRLARYPTMAVKEIASLPVRELMADRSHCYLWVPNALLAEGLLVLENWGFTYKSNLVWHKVRKDGGSDGRGVGFYFRNVTELVLFGTRGRLRTAAPARRQVNLFASRKREHSRKPDELYQIIEGCSPGPYLELFARHPRAGWRAWGYEAPLPQRVEPPANEAPTNLLPVT